MKQSTILSVAILTVVCGLTAFAQTAAPPQSPAPASTQTPVIDKREKIQEKRIEQGVKSGELTAGETRKLEAQQAKIKADKMMAKSDGKMTKAERSKIRREQNRASRKIYGKKHNANVQK